ncbi:MAG: class I SAM-dependent methyltransferase [Candidatus Micrarchaeia archaeon]
MTKREEFLSEIKSNILLPYETSKIYEEEIVGEFENHLEAEYFVNFCKLLKGKGIILDLACGDGRHTLQISRKANCVVALDLSLNNIKMAKKKCCGRKNITFIKGSMLDLPFCESTFDGIWFSQALEYVPPDKREKLLISLNHILKPGGILYMSIETWMQPKLLISLKELLGDLLLFYYWKFTKKKPLLWGEFFYCLQARDIQARYSRWHYHVHTDKWTLLKLLRKLQFKLIKMDLYDGYIYVLCKRIEKEGGDW